MDRRDDGQPSPHGCRHSRESRGDHRGGLLQRAAEAGEYLGDGLQRVAEGHPTVAFVAGVGLLWAIELVRDRLTGKPFVEDDRDAVLAGDLSRHPNNVVYSYCWERGLLVGGYTPNVAQLTPPLTISRARCDEALEILDSALSRVDAMA